MAAALTSEYAAPETCEAPAHVLFPQLARDRQAVRAREGRRRRAGEAVDVFLSPYYGLGDRAADARRSTRTRRRARRPRFRATSGRAAPGSTAEVDFWTAKPVREVAKSHLNYVVADTKWEQSAAYHLDTHSAWVRS